MNLKSVILFYVGYKKNLYFTNEKKVKKVKKNIGKLLENKNYNSNRKIINILLTKVKTDVLYYTNIF